MYNDDDAGTRFAVARVQLSVFTARQNIIATSRARRVIVGCVTFLFCFWSASSYRPLPTTQVLPQLKLIDFMVWTIPFPLRLGLHVVRLLLQTPSPADMLLGRA